MELLKNKNRKYGRIKNVRYTHHGKCPECDKDLIRVRDTDGLVDLFELCSRCKYMNYFCWWFVAFIIGIIVGLVVIPGCLNTSW